MMSYIIMKMSLHWTTDALRGFFFLFSNLFIFKSIRIRGEQHLSVIMVLMMYPYFISTVDCDRETPLSVPSAVHLVIWPVMLNSKI